MTFSEVDFGHAAAHNDASTNASFLLNGYYDPFGVIEEARTGKRFLFLGYKGSGKSAIGEHLRLLAGQESELFVRLVNLEDISFKDFRQILKTGVEPEARFPTTWSWLLLLYLFDSFRSDNGSPSQKDETFASAVQVLEELGMLPDLDLRRAVMTTSEEDFSLKLSGLLNVLEAAFKVTRAPANRNLFFFVDDLKSIAARFRSNSRHILVIDGFDDILRSGGREIDTLSALIFEADRLNALFRRNNSPTKIIILCRTDLFDRLQGPNNNKIRQDSGLTLNWYPDPNVPGAAPLISLINLRASLTMDKPVDVFDEWFPKTLTVNARQTDMRAFLLAYTRHTPRDIIMLLKYLQKFSGTEKLTEVQIRAGIRAYSREHFQAEILDEVGGFFNKEEVNRVLGLLHQQRKTSFLLWDLQRLAKGLRPPLQCDLESVMEGLFERSAVGNIESRKNRTYETFRCHDPNCRFHSNLPILVHRGLWEALDLS